MTLGKELLSVPDCDVMKITVAEWKGDVCIRQMTAFERDGFEASVQNNNLANIRARFAALVLCDDQGVRLFSDKDVSELGKKNGKALDRVFEAGRKFNGFSDDDVEELEKNSSSGPSGSSTSS